MKRLLCLGLLMAAPASGATWQPGSQEIPAVGMSVSLGSGQPVATGNGGEVFVLFQNFVDDTTFRVGALVRAADGTWLPPELLAGERNARNPSVAVGPDGRAHVAWEDITDEYGDIVYRVRGADGIYCHADIPVGLLSASCKNL